MKKLSLVVIAVISAFALVVGAQLSKVGAEDFTYVGTKKCMGCHRAEYKSWQGDYHAKALDDLKPGIKVEEKQKAKLDGEKDYSTDAGCLACHATGYGQAAAPGADLANVGCESCHGPGSAYKSPTIKSKKKWADNREEQQKLAAEAGLILTPSKESCVACHNEKSPTWKGFDYEKMLEEVKHTK
ncbi:MAG: hypothetical protein JXD19_00370 [Deltaproteobacteria bacterium]|nr:hypothetical protein [Deltaproteobacteria bacterium]